MLTKTIRLTAALLLFSALPAFAGGPNKDMIELETKVQQLLDSVARLQQSNDERMGVLKDLMQQNSDSVNRMSVTIDALQKQMATQQAATGAKVDTVSGQIQALNDSLDEIKARMNRLEKAVGDVSSQQQQMLPIIQNLPQAGPSTGSSAAPAQQSFAMPPQSPAPADMAKSAPPAPIVRDTPVPAGPSANAPLVDDMYKSAFNDFIAARYNVATAEFNDLIKAYPSSPLSGNAYYYLGEIDYRGGHYSIAVKDYDKVIEQYPDNNKVPAAHLHKGTALVEMQLKDAAAREFRSLIQRFPNSPEAVQARTRLNGLGARRP
jgi:tol-pal system protein YbgF